MKYYNLSHVIAICAFFSSLERTYAFSGSNFKNLMATAFTTSTKSTSSSHYKLYASSSSSENNDERSDKNKNESKSENDAEGNSPLSLPPIGESSYGTIASAFGDENNSQSSIDEETGHKQIILNSDKGTEVAQVGSSKFELQYTCNICETRNSHKVSRLAYTKGVVITVCKGCMTKHLIADNLGWSKFWGTDGFEGNTNIEEYMDDIGKGDEVNRVSKDVFHLEQLYSGDNEAKDSGEQLSDNDGNAFE